MQEHCDQPLFKGEYLLKLFLATSLMGLGVWALNQVEVSGSGAGFSILFLFFKVIVGAALYFALAYMLQLKEMKGFFRTLKKQ